MRTFALLLLFPLTLRADVSLRDGDLGGAHPTVLQLTAPDGRWLVACQARSDTDKDGKVDVGVGYHGDLFGDRLMPYLFVDGVGRPIDDVVAADPAGRHLAFVESGKLILESQGRPRLDLSAQGADARDDKWQWGGHRAAHFDAAGRRLLWLRGGSPVVRDLESGRDVVLNPGAGELWRAILDPDGAWVTVRVIVKDTDGNGKLEWPSMRTSLAARHCRGPIRSYSTYGKSGDDWVDRVIPVAGGVARELKDLIRPFGSELLRRRSDGALILEDQAGKIRELVPAACKGRLVQADPGRGKVVVVCATGLLEIHGAAVHKATNLKQSVPDKDDWLATTPRLVAAEGAVVDMDKDVIGGIAPANLIAEWQSHALTYIRSDARGEEVGLLDVDKRGPQGPLIKARGYPRFQSGPIVALGDLVFDLAANAVLGRVDGQVLAVSADGRVLVAASTKNGLPQGPLRWVRPQPIP